MIFKKGFALIFVVLLTSVISASFEVGNISHSIEDQYRPSEKILGWVNISLEDEPTNSLFEDSNGNSISLIELLEKNEGLGYSCNIPECSSDYSVDGTGKNSMEFNLESEQKKIIGLVLFGEEISIDSLALTIKSTAGASCNNQLEIDLLNDGSLDFMNEKVYSVLNSCESLLNRGCFNSSEQNEEYVIEKFPFKHCQRIMLSSSPGFQIGARINNQSNDMRVLKAALYNLNMEEVEGANCNLPSVVDSGDTSCTINYSVKEPSSYYVCIYSEETGTSKLQGYSDKNSGCGFFDRYSSKNPTENAAFSIFAQGMAFDTFGELNILDSSENTKSKVKNYIESIYGLECPPEGCIVPISFLSNQNQHISVENINMRYTDFLGTKEIDQIYSVKKIPSKVSSNFQKIFLEYGEFTAPEEYGNKTFKLYLNEEEVFSEKIQVKNFPKINQVSPRIAPSMIPTTFVVFVNSSKNIISYSWNFNDGTPIKTSTTNSTTHTYNASKNYILEVSVEDSEGLVSSKTFEILATIPKEEIESELEKRISNLERVKVQIASFSQSVQEGLYSVLRIEELEKQLKDLQREHSFASEEEDYFEIVKSLSLMEVPEMVGITKKVPFLPFHPMLEEIDLEVLKEIGGGTYSMGQRKAYQEAILEWQMENAQVKVSMEEFTVVIAREPKPVLTRIIISIEKNPSDEQIYFIIRKMKDTLFKERYFGKESGNYFYWILDENKKEIEFTTSEIIEHYELPAFVSPRINSIKIEEKEITPVIVNLKKRWKLIAISLGILLLGAFIVYTLLSTWYKRKYESYLFKNRNDLYNLISYINISKKKGEDEAQMKNNLKKSGWSGEQIAYVLKKYSGRRTGMIELPLTKLIDRILTKRDKSNSPTQRINPMRRPF